MASSDDVTHLNTPSDIMTMTSDERYSRHFDSSLSEWVSDSPSERVSDDAELFYHERTVVRNKRDSVDVSKGRDTVKVSKGRDTVDVSKGRDTVEVSKGVPRKFMSTHTAVDFDPGRTERSADVIGKNDVMNTNGTTRITRIGKEVKLKRLSKKHSMQRTDGKVPSPDKSGRRRGGGVGKRVSGDVGIHGRNGQNSYIGLDYSSQRHTQDVVQPTLPSHGKLHS